MSVTDGIGQPPCSFEHYLVAKAIECSSKTLINFYATFYLYMYPLQLKIDPVGLPSLLADYYCLLFTSFRLYGIVQYGVPTYTCID